MAAVPLAASQDRACIIKARSALDLGGQHTGGRQPGVVDECRVVIPCPLDGIGQIGNDQLKGFVVPVLGRGLGVLADNVELVKANIVEEHIDAAKVVGGDVDFLPEVAELHPVLAQHLGQ